MRRKSLFILSAILCGISCIWISLIFPLGLVASKILGGIFIGLAALSFVTSTIFGTMTYENKKKEMLMCTEVDNKELQKDLESKKNKVIIYNEKNILPIEFDIDKKYLDKFQHYISNVNSGDCRIEVYDDNFIKTEYKIDGKNYKRDLIPVLKRVRDIVKETDYTSETNEEELIK